MVLGVLAAVAIVVVVAAHRPRQARHPRRCRLRAGQMRCADVRRRAGALHRPAAADPRGQQREGDVLPDRQQGCREPRRRQAHRGGRHGGRQPYLGTPQHDHHPAAGHPRTVQQGQRRHRGGDRTATEAGPHRRRAGQRPGAGGGQEAGSGRHQLGRHPFRLDQRLQHRGHPLHADDADQAGISRAVPRHLLQHSRSGVPVHPRAQGQRLPPGDGQPVARTA